MFLISCADPSMLLFENCKELTFQAKSTNFSAANYAK